MYKEIKQKYQNIDKIDLHSHFSQCLKWKYVYKNALFKENLVLQYNKSKYQYNGL